MPIQPYPQRQKFASLLAIGLMLALIGFPVAAAQAATSTDFEPTGFVAGTSVDDLQPDGATISPAMSFVDSCREAWFVPTAGTDEEVVDLTFVALQTGLDAAGHGQVWRLSNGAASGSLGQNPHSPRNPGVISGETSSLPNDACGSSTTTNYYAQLDFRSVTGAAQSGPDPMRLAVSANSSDTRQAFLYITDNGTGLDLTYFETADGCNTFPSTVVATGLSYTDWHTLGIEIFFNDGLASGTAGSSGAEGNDVVNIYLDNVLVHTGTTWESCVGARVVDQLLFETSNQDAAFLDGGLYFDNVLVTDVKPVVQCTDTCYVDAVNGSDANGGDSAADAKQTIQAGVDQVNADGTVIVAAGTYSENVTLDKTVMLQGAQMGIDACDRDGTNESVITGSGTLLTLKTGSAGSVIDGFTFDGGMKGIESTSGPLDTLQLLNNRFIHFTISGVFLNDSGVDITVHQNLIDGNGQTGSGGIFHLDTDNFDGFHFTDNCVLNGDTGFFVDGDRNVGSSATPWLPRFDGNLFEGNGAGANIGRKAIEDCTFENNRFIDNTFDGLQGGPKDCRISMNVFSGNGRNGLRLTGFGGTGDAARGAQGNTIEDNCFTKNGFDNVTDGAAVRFDAQFAGTVFTNMANDNNIFGNRVGAFNKSAETTIDATSNWWGAASGPSGDGSGSGDSVDGTSFFGSIDFASFRTAPAGSAPACADTCDMNQSGIIDINDIWAILAVRNTTVTPGSPGDEDGDGIITVLDARKCVLKCNYSRCLPPPL